jgi:predicted TIM-barrel fold metal-dependent hydrolase
LPTEAASRPSPDLAERETLLSGPIDAHAHVFTTSLPVQRGARYRPHADAPTEGYLELLDRHAMAGAILVQPSFLGTDNSYMLAAVARAPHRFRAVAVLPPATAPADLAAFAGHGVVGIRLNLLGHAVPPLATAPWSAFLDALAMLGLFVEVQAQGEQWPQLLPGLLAARVNVVIDHLGRPQSSDPGLCPGFAAVLAAAADVKVWIKASAPYRFPAAAKTVVERVVERAGTGRLLWGSDWPWTQHPEVSDYGATRSWLDEWIGDASVRSQILVANPRRLLGLQPAIVTQNPSTLRGGVRGASSLVSE